MSPPCPLTVGSIVGRPCFLLRPAAGKPFKDWTNMEVVDWAKAKTTMKVVTHLEAEAIRAARLAGWSEANFMRSIWAAPMALRSTATYSVRSPCAPGSSLAHEATSRRTDAGLIASRPAHSAAAAGTSRSLYILSPSRTHCILPSLMVLLRFPYLRSRPFVVFWFSYRQTLCSPTSLPSFALAALVLALADPSSLVAASPSSLYSWLCVHLLAPFISYCPICPDCLLFACSRLQCCPPLHSLGITPSSIVNSCVFEDSDPSPALSLSLLPSLSPTLLLRSLGLSLAVSLACSSLAFFLAASCML